MISEPAETFDKLMRYIERFKKKLSDRDMLMMQIGMRACHIEEALAQGDTDRARSHVRQLVLILKRV